MMSTRMPSPELNTRRYRQRSTRNLQTDTLYARATNTTMRNCRRHAGTVTRRSAIPVTLTKSAAHLLKVSYLFI